MKTVLVVAAWVSCIAMRTGTAQELRGTVRDSTTQRLIAGAVVQLLDADGRVLDRTLSNLSGEYSLRAADGMHHMRFQRMGFRPREWSVTSRSADAGPIDVRMLSLPTMLEPVRVATSQCSPRADRAPAMAVYEHARAGLLAMAVARQTTRRGALKVVRFEQTMDGTSARIVRNAVWMDSSQRGTASFTAVQNAGAFLRTGFARESPDGARTFFAPDPEVLLDDAFARGYCFSIAPPQSARPNQVGLAFVPGATVRNRVDIEGTLWVDTLARSLRDIEFGYINIDPEIRRLRPGGVVSLTEMSNGLVIITRWRMRLIGSKADTTSERMRVARADVPGQRVVTTSLYAGEVGGELAGARWPDGTSWQAPLGRLRLHATTSAGAPAAGAVLSLTETQYRGKTDSTGLLELPDLVPGPYEMVVIDSAMNELDLTLPTSLKFTAVRDSTHAARLVVLTAGEYVRARCIADGNVPAPRTSELLGRLFTESGTPAAGVEWRVARQTGATRHGSRGKGTQVNTPDTWDATWSGGETGTDGVFYLCGLQPGVEIRIEIRRPKRPLQTMVLKPIEGITTVRIILEEPKD